MTIYPVGLNYATQGFSLPQANETFLNPYSMRSSIFGAPSNSYFPLEMSFFNPSIANFNFIPTMPSAPAFGATPFMPMFNFSAPQFNLAFNNNQTGINPFKFDFNNPFGTKSDGAGSVNKKQPEILSSLNLSDKELAKMGFNDENLRNRWKKLKPEFQREFIKLYNYAESKGIKFRFTERGTWRSHQDQIDIKKSRGAYAATPGHSPHEQGLAVDISGLSAKESQILGEYWEKLGHRWGGHFKNFPKEPWHFDMKKG